MGAYSNFIYMFCYREEDKSYKFNMNALHSFLNEQISKSSTAAKFYNVQVFRYEVGYTTVFVL